MLEATGTDLEGTRVRVYTPIKAIRRKCRECSNWNDKEVRSCHMPDCALWPYRMGRRPSDEDKRQIAKYNETGEYIDA